MAAAKENEMQHQLMHHMQAHRYQIFLLAAGNPKSYLNCKKLAQVPALKNAYTTEVMSLENYLILILVDSVEVTALFQPPPPFSEAEISLWI